ncbi:MAG: oxidoreductase, partial [Clostridia bacterium]|nr:oxidoreductase [Clostridia bacterium]
KMGASRWNLVLRPEGTYAAKCLAPRMDYRFVPVSYGLKQVDQQYEEIFEMLGKRTDLTPYRKKAEEAVAKALEAVGGRRIAVGASAVCRPYSLALALREYGFVVSDVFTGGGVASYEQEAYETLLRDYPDTAFHSIFSPENVRQVGRMGSAEIAIGYSAGYHTGAPIVVDQMTDEGMFGYRGIARLMEKLCQSIAHPQALEAMIESYGLIV